MTGWSIRGWLTRWLALTSVGLILAIAGFSGWFLHASVDRELQALVIEELDEMYAMLSASDGSRAGFDRIAVALAESHPANPLAWRVFEPDGTVWHEHGPSGLLAQTDLRPEPLNQIQRASSLRWRTELLPDGRRLGLVLDGTVQAGLLRRYWVFGAVLVGAASILAWGVAAFLSRRTSALLSVVAERARTADPEGLADGLASGVALPDEVRAVAAALGETLARIRSESDRAQLMTAGLAHELRSPLQNLLGEAEVALMRPRDSAEYRRVLESQLDELRDLGRSIDNLVLLCAQEEPAEHAESFDLGDEAALRLDRDSLQVKRAGVKVELVCDGDLTVRGDREALVLALRNLVGNAVAWSPADGVVRVAITGTEREVEVIVDDQGPGMAPELGDLVFEPFQRGPRAANRRVGFGLGLALARTAVTMHGGHIFAERSPLGGARVRFVLPRPPASLADSAEPRRAPDVPDSPRPLEPRAAEQGA